MEIKLSLWENSKTFLDGAISKAVLGEKTPVSWKFAILAIVQAIELAMKARLKREHRSSSTRISTSRNTRLASTSALLDSANREAEFL